MEIDGKRRSENFEDRGDGGAGGARGGGGIAPRLLGAVMRRFGLKGVIGAGLLLGGVYMFAPDSVRQAMVGTGGRAAPSSTAAKVCDSSPKKAAACDFSRVVLASTEDAWTQQFAAGSLPKYDGHAAPKTYRQPILVVFARSVSTGGCGNATSATGPFYCPRDNKLYIDPSFYDTLAKRLKSPGDFAQAYVLAHEVGHHVQNLIGTLSKKVRGETKEQVSVRVELQADCLAGVWGHTARADLEITDKDLAEAVQAAHSIGDDALGHTDTSKFSHGSSEQRMRWFRRGFDSGDPRRCDTFAVKAHGDL